MRRRDVTLVGALGLAMACSDQPAREAEGGGGGGTVVVCMSAEPGSLNAFVSPAQESADLTPLLFSTLLRKGEDGQPAAGLARSWEWGEEGRTLHFDLDSGVTWHDGAPVTAEDVAFTLRIAADTSYGYWSQADFAALDSAVVVDSASVRLHFDAAHPIGLEPFTVLPIQPRHLLVDIAGSAFARAEYQQAPVGSGPYRLRGQTEGGDVLLERRSDAAGPERIVLRFIPEVATRLVAMQTGEVHACVMGGGTADEVEDAGQLEALPLSPASVLFVALDTRVAPLDDARVRRALSAALDRDALARVTSPVARPAGSFVPMESPYRAAEVRQPDADLDLAAALLDSAGYRRAGEDIRVSADGTPLRITIASEQSARELLTFIQGQLRRVGIDARLELMEAATFYDDIQNPDRRPMAMAVTLIPDRVVDYDPEAELHSEGFLNLASYRSETVDSLIEELAASHEDADRERIFGELQRAVARDVPSLYIAYSPRILAVAPGLQGVEVDVRGPFASLEDWRVSR